MEPKIHLLEHQTHISKSQAHILEQEPNVSKIENHVLDLQTQVSKAQNDDFGEMANVFGVDFRDEDQLNLASPHPSFPKCNPNLPPRQDSPIPINLVARPPSLGPLPQPSIPLPTSHGLFKSFSS
jgi:hypothetical protein